MILRILYDVWVAIFSQQLKLINIFVIAMLIEFLHWSVYICTLKIGRAFTWHSLHQHENIKIPSWPISYWPRNHPGGHSWAPVSARHVSRALIWVEWWYPGRYGKRYLKLCLSYPFDIYHTRQITFINLFWAK